MSYKKDFLNFINSEKTTENNITCKEIDDEYYIFISKNDKKFTIIAGILSIIYYISSIIFLNISKFNEDKTISTYIMIFLLTVDIIMSFILYFSEKKFTKYFFRFLKILCMIKLNIIMMIYFKSASSSNDIIRIIYFLVLLINFSYLFFLENNKIFIIFFGFIFIGVGAFLYKGDIGLIIDIVASLVALATVYFTRNLHEIIKKNLFIEMYKNDKYLTYFGELINSLNSIIITFNNGKIINANNYYSNFIEKYCGNCSKEEIKIERDIENESQFFFKNLKELNEKTTFLDKISIIFEEKNASNSFIKIGQYELNSPEQIYYFEITYRKFEINNQILFDIMMNDVTEIKDSEKNKSEIKYKKLILAKIAHEFKTPINSIIGIINSIKYNISQQNKTIKIASKLEIILNLSNYSTSLVNDMIYYSEINNFQDLIIEKTIVNLRELSEFSNQVLKSLVKCKGFKKQIKIYSEYDDKIDNIEVYSDEVKLKQIILNLMSNSVKFTKNGFIKIKFVYDEINQEILITVEDTGIGIETQTQNIIFTDKINNSNDYNQSGSGLGLTISRSIAKVLSHKITFESIFQKGSKFNIHINSIKNYGYIISCNTSKNLSFYDCETIIKKSLNLTKIADLHELKLESNETELLHTVQNCNLMPINTDRPFINNNLNFNPTDIKLDINSEKSILLKKQIVSEEIIITSLILKEDDKYFKSDQNIIRILVIDDYLFIRKNLKSLIEDVTKTLNINVEIELGEDGVDLLYKIIKSQSDGNLYNLVFIDENMNYMNGSNAISIIRSLESDHKIKKVNIISVTAFEDEDTKNKIMKAGSDQILSKPCKKSDIMREIKKYCSN